MSVTYIDAIHDAQKDLLTEDRDVFLYGQDIGVFGGAFKATKGLKELFPDRVIDAPISEDAMAGMVTGAAVMGKKPIMEVQFADFSTIAFNQIVNMAATHYYRTGIPANITVRLPCGGTPGTGPFHSQSLEALFAHYPGLHVMTPATVADAYWMLRQAVEIPDPVIFLEHKFLYRWLKAEDNYREARSARPGSPARGSMPPWWRTAPWCRKPCVRQTCLRRKAAMKWRSWIFGRCARWTWIPLSPP